MNQKRITHMIEREKYFIGLLEGKDLSRYGYWDMGYHQGRLSVLENMEGMAGPWTPVEECLQEEDGD
ncbi:hypothetical protein QMP26_05375 [Enterocloster clostridioformis]|uniref:hypothetical protein n=1 Tax=Enterocloster clostridioformis TaxID=1531 RepID=UPI00267445E5|nr:hypothetical protein [Enterocloster clostridioformis]